MLNVVVLCNILVNRIAKPSCKQDNSDHQYRSFRDNVPLLAILVAIFLVLKTAYVRVAASRFSVRQDTKLYLVPFLLIFSSLMLLGLHGSSALKVLVILSVNYAIAKYTGLSKLGPILTWLFNTGVLFAADKYAGFPYARIHPSLQPLVCISRVPRRST